jgi:REP element-mobilizing transposase RayT
MRQFTVTCPDVDLAQPSASATGRYWYNLHLVLIVADRFRITHPGKLAQVRDAAFATATATGCRIAAVSIMPDHTHTALRGNIEHSPEEIALAFQNELAQVMGCRAWQDGYYAGTFSGIELPPPKPYLNRKQRYPVGNGIMMAVGDGNGGWLRLAGPGYMIGTIRDSLFTLKEWVARMPARDMIRPTR